MDDIALSRGVRRSLLTMQQTVALIDQTQIRIATGKKVTSALDNPTSYFIASGLENRATDLSRLLDSITLGIKALEATDQGVKGLKRLVETAQATARQALQDPSGGATKLTSVLSSLTAGSPLTLAGFANGDTFAVTYGTGAGAVTQSILINAGTTATLTGTQDVTGWTKPGGGHQIDFRVGGALITLPITGGETAATLTTKINNNVPGVTASVENGRFVLRSSQSLQIVLGTTDPDVLSGLGFGLGNNTATATPATTVQSVIDAINNSATLNPSLPRRVQASLVSGRLEIESLGAQRISLSSSNAAALTNLFGTMTNNRATLAGQFEILKEQMNQLAKDSGYNGVNLLQGDTLKVLFNEENSTFIDINGVAFDSTGLGFAPIVAGRSADTAGRWQSDTEVETALTKLGGALAQLRAQASAFGAGLVVLQAREDFTRQTILGLTGGATNLLAADTNEEGANLLSLQTRQQLTTQALSMTAQMDQVVLRLFA